jgi:hypothetical protein
MEERRSSLRMRGSLEDGPLVVSQHPEPGLEVGCMVRPRFKLRSDPEIGAKEATAKFRNLS